MRVIFSFVVEWAEGDGANPFHVPEVKILVGYQGQKSFVVGFRSVGGPVGLQRCGVEVFQPAAALICVVNDEGVVGTRVLAYHRSRCFAHPFVVACQAAHVVTERAVGVHGYGVGHVGGGKREGAVIANFNGRINQDIVVGSFVGKRRIGHGFKAGSHLFPTGKRHYLHGQWPTF